MATIQKTYKFRLDPSKAIKEVFAQYAGCARYVYNHGLALIKKALETKSKIPSYTDLANLLPQLKSKEETKWLREVHSQTLQQKLKDLDFAVKQFFNKIKKKEKANLHFKKKNQGDSFRFPQSVTCENDYVCLPKIGSVKYSTSREIEGVIKQATVKKEADHWYISIVCNLDRELSPVPLDKSRAIGIDLGLLNFAYMSNGLAIENPRFLKGSLTTLRKIQRTNARAKRGSQNKKKITKKLVKVHLKIRNQRNDFLHKTTSMLVKNHDILVVENLSIRNMVKNRHLSRSISDAGWGTFLNLLKYKCFWYDKHFVQIDKFEPTSKICSQCKHKQDMPLQKRTFDCSSCDAVINRDLNASKNIMAAGMSVLKLVDGNDTSLPNEARILGF